jgi:hypothetical protein
MLALPAHGVRPFALIRLGGCHLATVSRDAGPVSCRCQLLRFGDDFGSITQQPGGSPRHSRRPPADVRAAPRRAIALRRSGRSRREIKELLGITSNGTLDRALRGEPVNQGAGLYQKIEGWVRAAMTLPDTP